MTSCIIMSWSRFNAVQRHLLVPKIKVFNLSHIFRVKIRAVGDLEYPVAWDGIACHDGNVQKEILIAKNIRTRYCHALTEPESRDPRAHGAHGTHDFPKIYSTTCICGRPPIER